MDAHEVCILYLHFGLTTVNSFPGQSRNRNQDNQTGQDYCRLQGTVIHGSGIVLRPVIDEEILNGFILSLKC